jgi:hypothetical protein
MAHGCFNFNHKTKRGRRAGAGRLIFLVRTSRTESRVQSMPSQPDVTYFFCDRCAQAKIVEQ